MSGQDRRASQLDGGLVRCRRESAVWIKLPNWCRRASVPMGVTTVTTGLLTEMPVCTRLVVELPRLASLKLPQICELGVFICDERSYDEEYYGEEPNGEENNSVWEEHIAVNSNLSGLKLLHFWDMFDDDIKPARTDLF